MLKPSLSIRIMLYYLHSVSDCWPLLNAYSGVPIDFAKA